MAAVARDRQLEERIEAFLSYCIREWEAIPEVAVEWSEWGDLERLEFRAEWPIREDRRQQLREHAEQGLLTPAQWHRFDHLQRLVATHQPTLDRLLDR
jgi:hypothetical protein